MATTKDYEKSLIKSLEDIFCNELAINTRMMALSNYETAMEYRAIATPHENPNIDYIQYVLSKIDEFLYDTNIIIKTIQLKMPPIADLDQHNNKLIVLMQLRSDLVSSIEVFSKHVEFYFESLKDRKDLVEEVAKNLLNKNALIELQLFDKNLYDVLRSDVNKLAFTYFDLYSFIAKNKIDFKEPIVKDRRGNHMGMGMHN